MNAFVSDPTHEHSGPDTFWTTVNAAEALPGVSTPLNWTFFGKAVERAFRGTFADMGVISVSETAVPGSLDDRLWGIFLGRAAANLDTFRRLADRTPGTSGDALEEQIFGTVRPGVSSRRSHRRYPLTAVKLPAAALAAPRRLARHRASIEAFWQQPLPAGPEAAWDRFAEAQTRFEAVMRPHTLAAMLCQGIYEQLRRLALAADPARARNTAHDRLRLILRRGPSDGRSLGRLPGHQANGGVPDRSRLPRTGRGRDLQQFMAGGSLPPRCADQDVSGHG